MVLSRLPEMTCCLSQSTVRQVTASPCPSMVPLQYPVSRSHTRTQRSAPPVTSWESAARSARTGPVWPRSVCNPAPVPSCHTRTVVS